MSKAKATGIAHSNAFVRRQRDWPNALMSFAAVISAL